MRGDESGPEAADTRMLMMLRRPVKDEMGDLFVAKRRTIVLDLQGFSIEGDTDREFDCFASGIARVLQ